MTQPHPDSAAPSTTKGNVDIDIDLDTPTPPSQDPADEPALTTNEDAQRDDLPVKPGNS